MSPAFRARLEPRLERIAERFGTPFHIYDEAGIRQTVSSLKRAFAGVDYREYFAVKALPNPRVLAIMGELGFGFDCSSIPELMLARQVGAAPDAIMFTSNNPSQAEFADALGHGGCIVNLDDISLLDKLPEIPELLCFRYNPGPRRQGNDIIGKPEEAKFGVAHEQYEEAYRRALGLGAKRFGLHTMVISNETDFHGIVATARMMLAWAETLEDRLGIRFEFVNLGGGLGIPYEPGSEPLDIAAIGRGVAALVEEFRARRGYAPRIYTESGRYMTGPHGVLVARAINRKEIYRTYVGVDACMSALMRPGMYGAYHHVEVAGKNGSEPREVVDVVGPLCENNDKFAIQRELPRVVDGDLIVIHDTGAHGHSMGFTYNGRLRPQELLLRPDGSVERIRRAETVDDYFATLSFEPAVLGH